MVLQEAHNKTAPAGHDVTKPLAKPAAPAVEPPKTVEPPAQLQLTDLVAPEGFQIDPGLGTELITLINQSRNDPKALVNSLLALQAKANAQTTEQDAKQWDTVLADWTKATEADPEIGGAKYAANKAAVTTVVAKFGGPKMQEALELTGMGSHPEFMRFVSKIAPFLAEAAPVTPGMPTPAAKKATSTNLYPNQG